ncbi:unnamed protein product [Closterium sp. NIES-54]
MASHRLVSGLPCVFESLPRSPAPPCTPYVESRLHATPHSSLLLATAPFETLHLDVWGPAPHLGPEWERYFLVVVDDFSRYTTVSPLAKKVEVTSVLIQWLLATDGTCGSRVRCLYSDRGGDSPTSLWTRSPDVASEFHVWGCLALDRDTSADKLSARAIPCVFLGFPVDSPEFSFYHPPLHRFLDSRNVRFDESVSYYTRHPCQGLPVPPTPLFLAPSPPPAPAPPISTPPPGPAPSGVSHAIPLPLVARQVASPSPHTSSQSPQQPSELPRQVTVDSDGVGAGGATTGGTRSGGARSRGAGGGGAGSGGASSGGVRAGGAGTGGASSGVTVLAQEVLVLGVLELEVLVLGVLVQEALAIEVLVLRRLPPPASSLTVSSHPITDYCRAAHPIVSRVLASLVTNPCASSSSVSALTVAVADFASTRRLDFATRVVAAPPACPLSARVPPPRANIVNGMWLFKVKRPPGSPPGSPPVFKVGYVARGFRQREGVDFFQTFAPTPRMTTLRVLLHVVVQRDYELHSLEFSTAFLQGLYGLRQSPHEWYDNLRSTLRDHGFRPSSADPSLFVRAGSTPFFILVYVDDLVFATADRAALAEGKSELQKRHMCTDLGELRRYLSLQITRDRAAHTITLTQSHMV